MLLGGVACSSTTPAAPTLIASVSLSYPWGGKVSGIRVGDTTRLRFQAFDAAGALVTGVSPQYRSRDSTTASIRQDGLLTTLKPLGSTVIVASVNSGGRLLADSVIVDIPVALDRK